MTIGVFFLIILGVALILFVLDLLFAGGAVTTLAPRLSLWDSASAAFYRA